MRYDALIIGAGMSGLAAGIRLAHFDRKVAILERHSLWGGLNSFYKMGGRRFDTGLHALTNCGPAADRGAPLSLVLRQLRLRREDLKLGDQGCSAIAFPDVRLRFSNDFELLRGEVAAAFPSQREAFERLLGEIAATRELSEGPEVTGAREVLSRILSDPQLVEMLMLPICYYGSAREGDVDWGLFAILFRSIFQEGLARPQGGIRTLLDLLVGRLRELGAELRLRAGVERIVLADGRARGVLLEDGSELEADRILSSAGWAETLQLCGQGSRVSPEEVGLMSVLESISVLDRRPRELGLEEAIVFFNDSEVFDYRRPEEPVDLRSGIVCAPDNFAAEPPLPEGQIRLATLARPEAWSELPEPEYAARKEEWTLAAIRSAERFVPAFERHTVFRDAFTPRTIERFTGHGHGAIYGSPRKRPSGETGVEGLYLMGTDQGLLGVVGALLSGVDAANRHVLAPTPSPGAGVAP